MGELPVLLARLEAAWRAQNMPIASRLRRGVAEADLRAAWAPHGVTPSQETVEWFAWHDGADGEMWSDVLCTPATRLLTVAQSLDAYTSHLVVSGVEELMFPTWVPVAGTMHGSVVAIGCTESPSAGGAERGESLVANITETLEIPDVQYRPPVTTMVRWWIERHESGTWRWEDGHLVDHAMADPSETERLSGLV
ncbi:hypothetical protein CLV92_112135 [Kineococcus xinjiangensis]|uniref:Uncharacterized protein n=1 Tax=Kineococcus xinjiangensis TaxID=512762 RepID=A0A2S6IFF7_9ACTN|nr:hypothetical protein [Kineococcus xinjiangensis]PPK92955.1 hypothetical protein CLV92_112135 [Kineococcus xinjiangensis]